jgi:hypothetical protein
LERVEQLPAMVVTHLLLGVIFPQLPQLVEARVVLERLIQLVLVRQVVRAAVAQRVAHMAAQVAQARLGKATQVVQVLAQLATVVAVAAAQVRLAVTQDQTLAVTAVRV